MFEIVIKLDENICTRLFDNGIEPSEADITKIQTAIHRGTVLKPHGRLGDLDALEKHVINGIKSGNYEDGYEQYGHINDMDDCIEAIRFADTILEATEEEE